MDGLKAWTDLAPDCQLLAALLFAACITLWRFVVYVRRQHEKMVCLQSMRLEDHKRMADDLRTDAVMYAKLTGHLETWERR